MVNNTAKTAEKRPIRENSFKLLVWLHEVEWCRRKDLELIWEGVAKESQRSLLNYMIGKKWVELDREGDEEVIIGTWMGRKIIENECWALNRDWEKWDESWMEVILDNGEGRKEAALWAQWRRNLKKAGARQIVKGVYILPTVMFRMFLDIREAGVDKGVVVLRVMGEDLGNVLEITKNRETKIEAKRVYAGIGRQVERLLKSNNRQKSAIHRVNTEIFHLFFQLLFLIKEDNGFWGLQGRGKAEFRGLMKNFSTLYGKNNGLIWS